MMTPRTALPQVTIAVTSTSAIGEARIADSPGAPFTFRSAPLTRAWAADPVLVAATLAQLVDTVTGSDSGRSACRAIGEVAARLITGAEQAAVVVCAPDRRPDDAADDSCDSPADGLDGDLRLLMKAQDDTGEGPCLDTARTGEQLLVHDLRGDARWPRFTPRAPWQIHSILCTPLPIRGGRVGVLLVVSARAWAFDETSARLATVVAGHAALALDQREQIRDLRAVADSREVIGQATGILMQRHQMTAEQAFHLLARASQERNVKLRTLCEELTESVSRVAPLELPAADGGRPSGQE